LFCVVVLRPSVCVCLALLGTKMGSRTTVGSAFVCPRLLQRKEMDQTLEQNRIVTELRRSLGWEEKENWLAAGKGSRFDLDDDELRIKILTNAHQYHRTLWKQR